ncbi:MAG: hypothetical protein V3T21_03065 [Candidatus Margulisiibacteriota bacterium]
MLEFITDIIVGMNMVLIFGSVFLAMEIIKSLGMKQSYVLAKGWIYILPAVIIIAFIRVYDFFTEYSIYTASRIIQELMYLAFTATLFMGLLVQFMAIKKAMEGRE